ncbi:hypothetical protein [uncultured Sphingomonas sp.]|uniref:hypothetical protein n=1 Tax=uncultured Sphingomonas sp. TaxID=158754 RepID=UPI002596977C|nr:hypothetical protein [uncultured Sphingomonas sp.]
MATAIQADWLSEDSDPRIDAAVADFRQTVLDIRKLSAQLFPLPLDSAARLQLQDDIDDLVGGMQARADVLDITLDEMFRLINADLARQRLSEDFRPHGQHLRALIDENCGAYADEHTLNREINRLRDLLPAAVDRRIAADRACAGYAAGFAVRAAVGR